ncbi:4Fe-4S binding domain-containing protein [Parafrankia irregularis]|uniref:Ferredoxin n=1 Tax=Parafrankia irregularis TaxID=795642 RepID=A0A0S4QPM5_9ACTN|nr:MULTISPECIES: 4Fe-4S binding protein [Parafrankia]EFC83750.1 4Fe-4S ferredoxin iron-sulfur binding domain protein [Parafrankia sp. EUN1f]MBE3204209.1 4Fe-4S binding protein [Parafrankia sp. CH37]CUU57177.1 4Fe-4S binding domain-containing protein [Parafrankia irregularis]
MPFVITSACIDVKDGACLDGGCPADCIYTGGRKMYINPDECTECGACALRCPVGAAMLDEMVPEEEQEFIRSEELFFSETLPGRDEPIGDDPGGAAKVGKIDADSEFVANFKK